MPVQSKTLTMVHEKDPKQEIFDAIKNDIGDIEPTGGDILAVVYERPEKTKSGLYIPEKASAREEDRFQGIVALVVKCGPNVEKHAAQFKDGVPKIGDWVYFKTGDAISFLMGSRTIRQIEVQMIRGIVQRPDMVA